MTGYDAEEFERRAIAGDWKAAISVLSRASLKPEVLSVLMTEDAHIEVRLALAMRPDVTPEQLAWCAETDDAHMLNRLIAHPRTPLSTIKGIRDRSEGMAGEVWTLLHAYATRTAERRVREAGGLHRGT
ncbi:hypothetical protein F8G81_07520 [Arthrobacter sp. CDRTa11]|uniref:hypothetical protein n=1 Tax=Arthrobacter sp. CDRTa11 TaxID=2651199 RepID=UPI002265B2D3|nr:hypothetical protein [Arthrobacter sp. CDRTa11]UZX02482.1 hypothetical protein F8G81_07520 [Arthrobacter sp. CDRTa11]